MNIDRTFNNVGMSASKVMPSYNELLPGGKFSYLDLWVKEKLKVPTRA